MNHVVKQVDSASAWDVLSSDKQALLVDVRTEIEWNTVGVPNLSALGKATMFIELLTKPDMEMNPNFMNELEAQISKDAPVLFLCKAGGRSQAAAEMMAARGYTNCHNVLGGFEGSADVPGWQAMGLPTEAHTA